MAGKDVKSAVPRPWRVSPRAALFISLAVVIVILSLFRYVGERREVGFHEAAEEEYRRFLQETEVLSGGDGGALALNLTRVREFTPRGNMGVEIRIRVYGGEEMVLKKGASEGPYQYRRETRLLLYDSGEYLPAILEFRARGDAP